MRSFLVLGLSALFSAPLAAQFSTQGSAAGASQTLSIPLSSPGQAAKIEVGLVNGSIQIVGTSGKEVVVKATPRAKKEKDKDQNSTLNLNLNNGQDNDRNEPTASTGMRRISTGGSFELTAEERNNQVHIDLGNSWQSVVDLEIQVPTQSSVKASTVNHGNISVENVNGELEIDNVNGWVKLQNVSGSVVANTVNGDLTATFKNITPNTPMAFSTLNGKIDVTFPASLKATLKLKSDMGDVFSDFDVSVSQNQPKIEKSTENGVYRVSVENWVQGNINGGGPEFMMKTMNGSIYLRKAK
ncbi:DUF4097 family beta strand repeat-containing protein [Catalinimonas alkaloidigena]|nr:DUF4097 family beta strand repeat-containing protein [Catalinimonas alkaloidigena]